MHYCIGQNADGQINGQLSPPNKNLVVCFLKKNLPLSITSEKLFIIYYGFRWNIFMSHFNNDSQEWLDDSNSLKLQISWVEWLNKLIIRTPESSDFCRPSHSHLPQNYFIQTSPHEAMTILKQCSVLGCSHLI